MRIAFFSEVYWPMVSGVSNTLHRLAERLQAQDHEVRVYTASYDLQGSPDRSEVHRSPSRAFFLSPEVQWAFPDQSEIRGDLDAFRPEVVHLLTEFAMGLAGLRAARALRIPMISSAHTDYERYARRYHVSWAVPVGWHYLRWFYNQTHRVLAPTREYESHLHERGVRHTGIWSRGVDTDRFHPRFRSESYRSSCGAAPEDVLVTYVGRVAPEKSIELLLDAWELLGDRRRGARLAFVGDGLLISEIRRRGLPGVTLQGVLRGESLSRAYASADVFAFPSPTETFGNVLLEAMSSGLASLAVEAGGVLEFTHQGRNALLVPPHDPEAFAGALAQLIGDAELRRQLGLGARATAAARKWAALDERLLQEYAGAISASRERIAA